MRFLSLLLTLLIISCGSPRSATPNGVALAFGLTSFSGKTAILEKFAGHRIEVIEDSSLPPNDSRPPFSIYTVRIHKVTHREFSGEVRLEFLNDRLMGVWFYPDNVAAYRSAMNSGALNLAANEHVVTWTAADYRGEWYIAWEDKRLLDESRNWIERYAETSERQSREWA